MFGGNIEIVREAFHLWGLNPDGGLAPIDLARIREAFEGDITAASKIFDPDVEIHPPTGVSGGPKRGYQGLVRNWQDLLTTFDEYLLDPLEFQDAGDQVVVIQRNIGRTREMELDETFSVLFSFRAGRILRIQVFPSRDGAREAAALA
jgi:ketosteroid isomerase-like protein